MNRPDRPHGVDRASALAHFNSSFRQRYDLPALTESWLVEVEGVDEAWDEITAVRASGVHDPGCAILARIALTRAPRYAIGMLDGDGRAYVLAPDTGAKGAYRGHHVLLVNPLGGADNWADVAGWVRTYGGNKARSAMLAGLASEGRPDYGEIDRLLRSQPETGRAIVLPPDEAFSASLAAEVSYIYDVPIETLKSWKQRYRRELAAGRPGRPRKPVKPDPGM